MALRLLPKIDKRVTDGSEFDLAVVRGVLLVHNELLSDDRKLPQPSRVSQIVEATLGWVPEVLQQRAKRERLDASRLRWENSGSLYELADLIGVLQFMIGAFRLKPGQTIRLRDERSVSREQWYQEIVEQLDPIAGWRVSDRETRFVALPPLTGLIQCVAYAVAVIEMKKLEALVRPCRFLREDVEGSLAHHYFLADDPRQRFCSSAHSNAHRQREWRRDHALPRKHK